MGAHFMGLSIGKERTSEGAVAMRWTASPWRFFTSPAVTGQFTSAWATDSESVLHRGQAREGQDAGKERWRYFWSEVGRCEFSKLGQFSIGVAQCPGSRER